MVATHRSIGMAMLKMFANCFSASVFYPSCGIGMDGSGFWRASMRSSSMYVTTYAGYILGNLFCIWIFFLLETRYDAILVMYNVIHG